MSVSTRPALVMSTMPSMVRSILVAVTALLIGGSCKSSTEERSDPEPRERETEGMPEEMVPVPAGWYVGGYTGYPELDARWREGPPESYFRPSGVNRLSSAHLQGKEIDNPPQRFWVSSFQIDRYEVAWGRYAECVDAGACDGDLGKEDGSYRERGLPERYRSLVYPAIVRWEDANAYCRWRGKRLPTEAEWEKTARGEGERVYPWGNEPPTLERAYFDIDFSLGRRIRGDMAEYRAVRPGPIGQRPAGASPYGVHDMAGNAPEWVSDLDTWRAPRRGTWRYSDNIDPTGPAPGSDFLDDPPRRVSKGIATYLEIGARFVGHPTSGTEFVAGIRCARSVPGPPPPEPPETPPWALPE